VYFYYVDSQTIRMFCLMLFRQLGSITHFYLFLIVCIMSLLTSSFCRASSNQGRESPSPSHRTHNNKYNVDFTTESPRYTAQ